MNVMAGRLIVIAIIVLTCPSFLRAQSGCPTIADDGFAGGTCCMLATPNIPTASQIPVMDDQGQYGVFDNCSLSSDTEVTIVLRTLTDPGPPGTIPTYGLRACDELLFRVEVISAPISFSIGQATPTTVRGTYFLGKFTRTWTMVDEDNVVWQTWRYLGSGDATGFSSNLTPSSPDPIPSCYSATGAGSTFSAVAFHGTIDISCGKVDDESVWRFSLSLSHYDGCLSHLPSPLNDRSLTGSPPEKHLGYSYHLVNPKNFNWLAGTPVSNSVLSVNSPLDAVRSTVTHTTNAGLPGPRCFFESATSSQTAEIDPYCGCDSMTSGNYHPQAWIASVTCATTQSWSPADWIPNELPHGFVQIYLGQWGSTARDDVKGVWDFTILGTLDYPDLCDTWRMPGQDYKHIVFGTNYVYDTEQSLLPILFNGGATATDMLLDFGDSCDDGETLISPTPPDFPKFGTPEYTNVLWMISR